MPKTHWEVNAAPVDAHHHLAAGGAAAQTEAWLLDLACTARDAKYYATNGMSMSQTDASIVGLAAAVITKSVISTWSINVHGAGLSMGPFSHGRNCRCTAATMPTGPNST